MKSSLHFQQNSLFDQKNVINEILQRLYYLILTLASGSEDQDVRLWHIKSRQCLRILPHKGVITTLIYLIPKPGMLKSEDYVEELTFSLLEKTVIDKQSLIKSDIYALNIMCSDKFSNEYKKEPSARELLLKTSVDTSFKIMNNSDKKLLEKDDVNDNDEEKNSCEIQRLKLINQKLYETAVKNIIKDK